MVKNSYKDSTSSYNIDNVMYMTIKSEDTKINIFPQYSITL